MEAAMTQFPPESLEFALRDDLARGDVLIASARPVLHHLLANDDRSMFSDAVLARIRGMLADLERQLLAVLAEKARVEDRLGFIAAHTGPLLAALTSSSLAVIHAHALAVEWQVAEQLESRDGLDPVLSPLLQKLISSQDADVANIAMSFLASQARFVQQQRRMELPIAELPGDIFHTVFDVWRECTVPDLNDAMQSAEHQLRAAFDEGSSRFGLMSRLVTGIQGGAVGALELSSAGVALFLTGLALATGRDRRIAVLSTHEGQLARFLLSLRSVGLEPNAVIEQLAFLHPDVTLPDGLDALDVKRAASLLSGSGLALVDG